MTTREAERRVVTALHAVAATLTWFALVCLGSVAVVHGLRWLHEVAA